MYNFPKIIVIVLNDQSPARLHSALQDYQLIPEGLPFCKALIYLSTASKEYTKDDKASLSPGNKNDANHL